MLRDARTITVGLKQCYCVTVKSTWPQLSSLSEFTYLFTVRHVKNQVYNEGPNEFTLQFRQNSFYVAADKRRSAISNKSVITWSTLVRVQGTAVHVRFIMQIFRQPSFLVFILANKKQTIVSCSRYFFLSFKRCVRTCFFTCLPYTVFLFFFFLLFLSVRVDCRKSGTTCQSPARFIDGVLRNPTKIFPGTHCRTLLSHTPLYVFLEIAYAPPLHANLIALRNNETRRDHPSILDLYIYPKIILTIRNIRISNKTRGNVEKNSNTCNLPKNYLLILFVFVLNLLNFNFRQTFHVKRFVLISIKDTLILEFRWKKNETQ